MKKEDIIGKEIIGFRYKKDPLITWYSGYDKFIGKKGIVTQFHSSNEKYCQVQFDGENIHYPVAQIYDYLKEIEEIKSINLPELFNQIRQL